MNPWVCVFLQSPVNGGRYEGYALPQGNWEWPKGTWFQTRLSHVRKDSFRRLKPHEKATELTPAESNRAVMTSITGSCSSVSFTESQRSVRNFSFDISLIEPHISASAPTPKLRKDIEDLQPERPGRDKAVTGCNADEKTVLTPLS